MNTVILFHGQNTNDLIKEAKKAGLITGKDEVIVLSHLAVVDAMDKNVILITNNASTTQLALVMLEVVTNALSYKIFEIYASGWPSTNGCIRLDSSRNKIRTAPQIVKDIAEDHNKLHGVICPKCASRKLTTIEDIYDTYPIDREYDIKSTAQLVECECGTRFELAFYYKVIISLVE